MLEFVVETGRSCEMIDITNRVRAALEGRSGDGALLVYCPHTTAAVTINENADPDVCRDMLFALSRISPKLAEFQHREGNSDAHVKAALVGASVTVPVASGRLCLGTWQGIWLCEFDGPRRRRVLAQWLGA